ncbi:MAG: PD-(D/E)XK nuclease family protein [Actinobacteria bacterium]|nr:MAG: PD-(D/E)XK nuclease family protein [Actinomycetota bacterium]
MRLSYSAVSTYQTCPLKYKFQYIDKLPTKPSAALSFGSSLHSALEFMYKVKVPTPPSLEDVLQAYRDKWKGEGYTDKAEEKSYFEHGKQVLTNYYNTNTKNFVLPVNTEHMFNIDIKGVNFTGVIDRLDKIDENSYEVIDYKSNRKLPPLAEVEKNLQLTLYHLAVTKIWGFEPEKVSLYFLLPNQKLSTSRSQEQVDNAVVVVLKTAENIDKGLFKPKENPLCPWCDFQEHCPFFKHKFAKVNLPQEKMIDIKKVVDEYGKLKSQEKELKEKITAIAADIKEYCQENNLNRLYAEIYEIVRRETEKVDYDEDMLKEILEEAGILDKLLTIDKKLLKELIQSDIDKKIKKKLQDIAQTTTSYSLYCKKTKKS